MGAEGRRATITQAVVESFDDAVDESVADVAQDSVAVLADRAGHAHEGLEARADAQANRSRSARSARFGCR